MDPRIARSRGAVGRALADLLAEGRPYAEVTVSEVAARAGITRKTFYAHFSSVDDVVRQFARELFESVLAGIDDASFRLPVSQNDLGLAIYRRLHHRLDALKPLASLCPTTLFLEPAREVVVGSVFRRLTEVNRLGPTADFDREFLAHMVGAVLHASITAWAARDFVDTPDTVAAFVMEMLGPPTDRIFTAARGNDPGI